MIGEIRKAITPYYDMKAKATRFKSRPVLIIAKADSSDFVALPVSRVSRRQNLSPDYDIELDPANYPALSLNAVSYIRTHKQTVIHTSEIGDKIGNIKADYEDLYLDILTKRAQFSDEITNQAIK